VINPVFLRQTELSRERENRVIPFFSVQVHDPRVIWVVDRGLAFLQFLPDGLGVVRTEEGHLGHVRVAHQLPLDLGFQPAVKPVVRDVALTNRLVHETRPDETFRDGPRIVVQGREDLPQPVGHAGCESHAVHLRLDLLGTDGNVPVPGQDLLLQEVVLDLRPERLRGQQRVDAGPGPRRVARRGAIPPVDLVYALLIGHPFVNAEIAGAARMVLRYRKRCEETQRQQRQQGPRESGRPIVVHDESSLLFMDELPRRDPHEKRGFAQIPSSYKRRPR